MGGLISGTLGLTGNYPKVNTPNVGRVGKQYQALLDAYIRSAPSIYNEEAQYQPLYTQLGIQNRSATRGADVSDVARLSPDVLSAARGYNPQVTGLLDKLGTQAQTQLDQNGGLDPAMARQVQQSVRGSEAARGLGYGPGDVAQETNYMGQTMEKRRAENQQFAGQVAGEQQQAYRDPFSVVMGMTSPVNNAPSIISGQQSDSMMGTVYNAQANANIANANTQTALLQGFSSVD